MIYFGGKVNSTLEDKYMREYFFEDIKDLIAHLKHIDPDMGPIRLQKTLYFLFAFYGATYGSIGNENNEEKNELLSEVDSDFYPKQLFANALEAWQYGPVIRDVYFGNKNDEYEGLSDQTGEKYSKRNEQDVIFFLDGLVNDMKEMSDFALVDRTHQDKAWKDKFDAVNPYASNKIDKQALVQEYKEKIKAASEI